MGRATQHRQIVIWCSNELSEGALLRPRPPAPPGTARPAAQRGAGRRGDGAGRRHPGLPRPPRTPRTRTGSHPMCFFRWTGPEVPCDGACGSPFSPALHSLPGAYWTNG
eukprot:EG_transcript_55355